MKRSSKSLQNTTSHSWGLLGGVILRKLLFVPTLYREGPLSICCLACLDGFSQMRGIPSQLGQGSVGTVPTTSFKWELIVTTKKKCKNPRGRTLAYNHSYLCLLKCFPHGPFSDLGFLVSSDVMILPGSSCYSVVFVVEKGL